MITAIVVAAIPIPDAVAVTNNTVPEPIVSTKITYPQEDIDKNYKTLAGKSEFNFEGDDDDLLDTLEISQNSEGGYELSKVFKIWIHDDGYGVISDFDSSYTPKDGILTIPNNVVTNYLSFTKTIGQEEEVEEGIFELTMDAYLSSLHPENDKIKVNAFFDIIQDSTGVWPEKHYVLLGDQWVDSITEEVITEPQKMKLYPFMKWNLEKGTYEIRKVKTSLDTGGSNINRYFAYITGTGKYAIPESKSETSIKAIGDNAFYDTDTGESKANHIANLNLLISENIQAIGHQAFRGASTLNEVSIGGSIGELGSRAFLGCTALNKLTFTDGIKKIGIESFKGCNSLTEVEFKGSMNEIKEGAFAECGSLKKINMAPFLQPNTTIGRYAFYNCPSLSDLTLSSYIGSIGEGCFATERVAPGLEKVEFPSSSYLSDLGDGIFAGQENLVSILMPDNFGKTGNQELGADFFYGCKKLEQVKFPETCQKVTFPTTIFDSVLTDNFRVVGPASITGTQPEKAKPRLAAHAAGVPYQYTENGVTYLELKEKESGDFYRINEKEKQLISFAPEASSGPIDLNIYDSIGGFPITSVKEGCFDEVKNRLKSVTIHDNSIAGLDTNIFKDATNLEEVYIGNSVTSIGANAFLNCPKITEITFATPLNNNYGAMTIGADAFKTGSSELVLRGSIHPDYAPYKWAMDSKSVLDDQGKRVAYKSNAPSNLIVIQDNIEKNTVIIDYPHFANIDKDNEIYKEELIDYYQGTVSGNAVDIKEAIETVIDFPFYIQNKFRLELGEDPLTVPSSRADIDLPADLEAALKEITEKEKAIYNSIMNVVIPAGVTSIDSKKFYDPKYNSNPGKDNKVNWNYVDSDKRGDYWKDNESANTHGGLFSGPFNEFTVSGNDLKTEKYVNGNDRVETITLTDVISLPDYAFDSCENLTKVTLGSKLTEMGATPFLGCTDLEVVVGNDKFIVENKMVYSKNADETLTLVECLPSRGLSSTEEKIVSMVNDPLLEKVTSIEPGAFKGCEGLREVDLSEVSGITEIQEETFNGCIELTDVKLPKTIKSIKEGAFKNINTGFNVEIPVRSITIENAFDRGKGKITTYADSAARTYADNNDLLYAEIGTEFKVSFLDFDGTDVIPVQFVISGGNALDPEDPTRTGYTFTGWNKSFRNITEDTIIIAQYKVIDPKDPTTPDKDDDKDKDKDDDDDDKDKTKYKVKVESGSGSNDYAPGSIINITANASPDGKIFDKWTTKSTGIYFANLDNVTTSFVMPSNDVTVTPIYKDPTTEESSESDKENDTDSGSGTDDNENAEDSTVETPINGTIITITKPGIENKETASAVVNGSSDSFVIKITESAEAQVAMQKALIEDSTTGTDIKYFPMDISMYDSTGTIKIENTENISVTISLPIPEELKEYGGNNKIAAINDYGELEILPVSFATISGVPSIKFTTSHFSPYAVYVDTGNLTAGSILDENPKTGDGLHPKWFLVMALSSMSILLFIKKDKKVLEKFA